MADRAHLPWLWPFSAAAEAAATFAGEMTRLIDRPALPELPWTTANRVALELPTVRLRDFSRPDAAGRPVLIDAPFAVHTAVLADLAPGHSLVEVMLAAGIERVYVTDWTSATAAMRGLGIDDYLAHLNVLVDDIGPPVDLVGLCQGGWLALLYAARFPHKVGALALAGAPIDTRAGHSRIAERAQTTPIAAFRDLVALHGGIVPGRLLQQRWPKGERQADTTRQCLQLPGNDPRDQPVLDRFAAWDAAVVDLPGRYYLETVEWLFQDNRLATGRFEALGRRVDLRAVRHPLFLLAGADDDVAPPEQVLATAGLVGTPASAIVSRVVPAGHLALFMGRDAAATAWAELGGWLRSQGPARPARARRRSGSSAAP